MITPIVGHFVTINGRCYWSIYNKIVVASNDNQLSQVTLPGFSICVRVPVIRCLTRFLSMAEVAEVEDGEVTIDCVAIFYEESKGGEHYRKKISLYAGFQVQKNGL